MGSSHRSYACEACYGSDSILYQLYDPLSLSKPGQVLGRGNQH